MDLKKYDKLREKIKTKDFEGNNQGLDKWLYAFSFVGNISAIFFAYFLVYPSLLKAITLNFLTGFWGTAIAFLFTIVFLSIFEITKRYFIKNFSNDYLDNKKKVNAQILGWFALSLSIVVLSFYLSITGSKNLATTSLHKNVVAETEVSSKTDSLAQIYGARKGIYENDNEALRKVNNDLRNTLAQTPINYMSARRDYQSSIDKNTKIIGDNQAEITKIISEENIKINELRQGLDTQRSGNQTEDVKNIFLFIVIVIFNEVLIIGGIYFREFFEHKLFELNHQRFEKIYQKKDRYRALLAFTYGSGKLVPGDKVISGAELKEIVAEKTNIQNSNKLIEEFLQDMDRLCIFATNGKRRHIVATYQEAIDIVEKFDDAFRVIENMK
jgi:hypothetical protein